MKRSSMADPVRRQQIEGVRTTVWTLTRDDLDVVYVVGFAPQPDP